MRNERLFTSSRSVLLAIALAMAPLGVALAQVQVQEGTQETLRTLNPEIHGYDSALPSAEQTPSAQGGPGESREMSPRSTPSDTPRGARGPMRSDMRSAKGRPSVQTQEGLEESLRLLVPQIHGQPRQVAGGRVTEASPQGGRYDSPN